MDGFEPPTLRVIGDNPHASARTSCCRSTGKRGCAGCVNCSTWLSYPPTEVGGAGFEPASFCSDNPTASARTKIFVVCRQVSSGMGDLQSVTQAFRPTKGEAKRRQEFGSGGVSTQKISQHQRPAHQNWFWEEGKNGLLRDVDQMFFVLGVDSTCHELISTSAPSCKGTHLQERIVYDDEFPCQGFSRKKSQNVQNGTLAIPK